MTEEMVGGQHRRDEATQKPSLLWWTLCRPRIAATTKHKTPHNVCPEEANAPRKTSCNRRPR